MATNLEIAGAVKRTQKGAADWYYGGDNEAWPDMATALANIPASVRPGKTIGVFAGSTIIEYWWPTEAVADNNLIPKTPDLSAYATTNYVDSSLVSAIKLRGDWDISSGNYPTTGGSGISGNIKEGNAWRISNAGTIGTQSFDTGDFIVALIDNATQNQSDWTVLEHNDQQATETNAGIAKITSQAIIQTETTTNDTDTVTPKKFWQGLTRYASIALTIIGDRIFNGLVSIVRTVPELRWSNLDGLYARFQRTTINNNNQFVGKNQVLKVGGIGKALIFNGTNQYFTGDDAGLPSGSQITMTVSVWAKTISKSFQPVLSYGTDGNGHAGLSFTLCTQGNNNPAVYNGFNQITSGGGNSVMDSNFHHFVFVINGRSVISYIDGISNSIAISASYNVSLNGILTNNFINVYPTATFDQLLIWNIALTPSQVSDIFNSGSGTATLPISFNLLRRYEFEEGTGNITNDINPNGTQYPLTLFNSPIWTNNGIVPVAAASSESQFFSITDGLTNAEKGIAAWGDFNGRNQQVGKWFQWYQNNNYPLASNNSGQFSFDPTNPSNTIPTVASTVDIAGNLTIGKSFAGNYPAPVNGVLIEGTLALGQTAADTSYQLDILGNTRTKGIPIVYGSTPESRWETPDGATARFQRDLTNSNSLFIGKNNVLQVGGIGKALRFNGINQYFMGNDAGLPIGNWNYNTATGSPLTLSISIWIKTLQETHLSILSYGTGNTSLGAFVDPNTGLVGITVGTKNLVYLNTLPFNNDKWHNLILVVTQSPDNSISLSCYLDGILFSISANNSYIVELSGIISNNKVANADIYPTSTIDQFLIYNIVLTPTQVNDIYNQGAGTSSPPLNGLIRRYEFEDGIGNIVSDSNIGTQYPLTLFNSPIWDNNGIVPISAVSTETNFFSITDGLTNAERGVATWGDFNGRNQQTGKWFQWFQNGSYPLISNNSGQWLFNPVNQNAGLPTIASTIDIAGNLTIGLDASGNIMAPSNGLYVQGDVIIGNKINVVTGTNASIGSANLINGTVTINTTTVTAESIIMYCVKAISGSVGFLSQGTITPGISFVINSSSSSDYSTINWWIIN